MLRLIFCSLAAAVLTATAVVTAVAATTAVTAEETAAVTAEHE